MGHQVAKELIDKLLDALKLGTFFWVLLFLFRLLCFFFLLFFIFFLLLFFFLFTIFFLLFLHCHLVLNESTIHLFVIN